MDVRDGCAGWSVRDGVCGMDVRMDVRMDVSDGCE